MNPLYCVAAHCVPVSFAALPMVAAAFGLLPEGRVAFESTTLFLVATVALVAVMALVVGAGLVSALRAERSE